MTVDPIATTTITLQVAIVVTMMIDAILMMNTTVILKNVKDHQHIPHTTINMTARDSDVVIVATRQT